MIARYTRPAMGRIWSDENKYRCWLTVETAASQALARFRPRSRSRPGHHPRQGRLHRRPYQRDRSRSPPRRHRLHHHRRRAHRRPRSLALAPLRPHLHRRRRHRAISPTQGSFCHHPHRHPRPGRNPQSPRHRVPGRHPDHRPQRHGVHAEPTHLRPRQQACSGTPRSSATSPASTTPPKISA